MHVHWNPNLRYSVQKIFIVCPIIPKCKTNQYVSICKIFQGLDLTLFFGGQIKSENYIIKAQGSYFIIFIGMIDLNNKTVHQIGTVFSYQSAALNIVIFNIGNKIEIGVLTQKICQIT